MLTFRPEDFPQCFHSLLERGTLYDSSCSLDARVWFLDHGDGYYLKAAGRGILAREATMTEYFFHKGLGAEVLDYVSEEQDWILTRRIEGEDCLDAKYQSDPKRLCDLTAELLRRLHDMEASDCPVNATKLYVQRTHRNYQERKWNEDLFPDNWGYASAAEAWETVEKIVPYLHHDVLIHGDYCLPNIMLQDWRLSAFIDLGGAGLGDRHIDLFWGLWSLSFNLHTDQWRERFLDAYGRSMIEPELLDAIGAFEVFAG